MSFTEQYINAVGSSDLRDDDRHFATEKLHASASADLGAGVLLGSVLCRVKYADGTVHKTFESGSTNLAALLSIWTAAVTEKGQARHWAPTNTAWDMSAAFKLYEQVAHASLAHWLDGRCADCEGAGVTLARRTCQCCEGSGRAAIEGGRFVTDKVKDMVSELEGIFQAHNRRASTLLRRPA